MIGEKAFENLKIAAKKQKKYFIVHKADFPFADLMNRVNISCTMMAAGLPVSSPE